MIERYTLPDMAEIWTDANRFTAMLKVEVLACEAQAKLGNIPRADLLRIKKRAGFTIRRIRQIEAKTRHDVIAFLENVTERVGPSGRYLHMGMTSSDALDTALAVQMKEAADILIVDLHKLAGALAKKAKRYKTTVMVGRSHGVHAEPTTFGLKMALFYDEAQRNIGRMEQAKEVISVGKISGAVGTYANVDPMVEDYVCKKLGLRPARISTQIIQRDRIAQFLSTIAIVGSCLEKLATEIRNLQRTEVLEVEEPFYRAQKGSSAMPHKRNPIACERIAGLARLLRGNAMATMENITLWHERDISHSSVERVVIPDSTTLLDYMIQTMTRIIDDLLVYPKRMRENLEATRGLIYSQRVMLELMGKGLNRKKAYSLIQRAAMEAWKARSDFKTALKSDRAILRNLNPGEIDNCFDIKYHTKFVNKIFRRVGV